MNELFSLVGQYKDVYEMLTDPDIDDEVVYDTLEGLMGEMETHAEGLATLIHRVDMELDVCKKNKDEWALAEKVRKNRKARLTDMIKAAMKSSCASSPNGSQPSLLIPLNGCSLKKSWLTIKGIM